MHDPNNPVPEGTPEHQVSGPPPQQNNIMAIIGLITAIVGLLLCWVTFAGLAISVVGLILSIMGSKKANELRGIGKGPAIGGIVVAIFGILFGGAFTTCQLACAAAVQHAGSDLERMGREWEAAGKQLGQELEKAMREAAKEMEEAQKQMEEAQKQQKGE